MLNAYLYPNRYRWQFFLCRQSQTKYMPANVQQVKNIASVELVSLPCIVNNVPFFGVDVPAVVISLILRDECETPVKVIPINLFSKSLQEKKKLTSPWYKYRWSNGNAASKSTTNHPRR